MNVVAEAPQATIPGYWPAVQNRICWHWEIVYFISNFWKKIWGPSLINQSTLTENC